MTENVAQIRVSNPKELVAFCEALRNSWFRGQGSAQWGLESSLERDARNYGVPRDNLGEREKCMLRLFKKRAHLYGLEFEAPKTDFEWYALIRHYGGPSRLLDVTSSYLVAAYFALYDSQPKRDAVIWAFREGIITKDTSFEPDTLVDIDSKPILIIASPERLNIRLNAQSGEFFVPGSVATSLEDQVGSKFNTDVKAKPTLYKSLKRVETSIHHRIWKCVFPRAAHSEIFRFISRCNVRSYSLFPGIDGLAASLREMMRAYE